MGVADAPDAVVLPPGTPGSVAFRDVHFAYVPGQPVLRGVSLDVRPGETVALVGPTGSGKSSIMALIHRFYDVSSGTVMVGGHDVRKVMQASLGAQIAMVLQEPYLFTGTVMDNIRYNKATASDAEVMAAARTVGADDVIQRLPKGCMTELNERGANLSMGQRQLISFARALVADTPILVLDEATSSIDSQTEKQIQQALTVLLRGRTGLIIAHRLATVRHADRILILSAGRIVEQGSHADLMALDGTYATLYKANRASFDDGPVRRLGKGLHA